MRCGCRCSWRLGRAEHLGAAKASRPGSGEPGFFSGMPQECRAGQEWRSWGIPGRWKSGASREDAELKDPVYCGLWGLGIPKLGSQSRGALSLPGGSQGDVLGDRGWLSPVRWPLWLHCPWRTAGRPSRPTGTAGDCLGPPRLWSSSTKLLHFLLPLSSTSLCGMLRPGSVPAAVSGDAAFGRGDCPAEVLRGQEGKEGWEPPAELFTPLGGIWVQLPAPSCPTDSARGSCRAGGRSGNTTATGRWLCPAPGE